MMHENILATLKKLSPEVAEAVEARWEADRQEYLRYVEERQGSREPREWAKPSCQQCRGKGTIHNLTKEATVLCSCAGNRYQKWLRKMRESYNGSKAKND